MSGVAPQEGVGNYFIYKPVHGAVRRMYRVFMDEADSRIVCRIRCAIRYFRLRPYLAEQLEVSLLQDWILAPLVGVTGSVSSDVNWLTLQGIAHLHGRIHPSRIWLVPHRQSRHIHSFTGAIVCCSTGLQWRQLLHLQ